MSPFMCLLEDVSFNALSRCCAAVLLGIHPTSHESPQFEDAGSYLSCFCSTQKSKKKPLPMDLFFLFTVVLHFGLTYLQA